MEGDSGLGGDCSKLVDSSDEMEEIEFDFGGHWEHGEDLGEIEYKGEDGEEGGG